MSPSGPSPRHLTRYCLLWPLLCLSMILSMKNSWVPLMVMGFGGCSAWDRKRSSLFSWNGLTSEVWKMGKWCESFGRASVTVECFLLVLIIGYGPSNQGMNLATCSSFPDLYIWWQCAVESTTQSPVLNGNWSCRCTFSWCACQTFAVRRLSCASIWRGCICVMSLRPVGLLWSSLQGSIGGSIQTGLDWEATEPMQLQRGVRLESWTTYAAHGFQGSGAW